MSNDSKRPVTPSVLATMKERGEKIAMLTAYDHPTARLCDEGGADVILVGDSLSMVVLGYENTLPVSMDVMIHHTAAVTRGAERALVIGDMPYGSYHVSQQEAVRNAIRFMKEAGAGAVKLEGGRTRVETVRAIVAAEIPIMGHVGLTPQSVKKFGGYKVQGKGKIAAQEVLEDALALQEAGCFSIVLEGVPTELAAIITDRLDVPTIGIGAGSACDGQVLVYHDMLGMSDLRPKFVRVYDEIGDKIRAGIAAYTRDVKNGSFPDDQNEAYHTDGLELEGLKRKPEGWVVPG